MSIRFTLLLALSALACTATTFPPSRALDAGSGLRVATWNVGLGQPLETWPGETLADHPVFEGTELLALQEICSDDGGRSLQTFAAAMRQHQGDARVAFVRTDPADPMMCARGQALVSAYPIIAYGRVELPRARQVRSFLWADVRLPEGQVLRVYVPHFENRTSVSTGVEGRAEQALVLLDHLEGWRARHPGRPVLVMGDLNTVGNVIDPGTRELAIELLSRHLEPSLPRPTPTMPTWPWQVDWIFAGGLELQGSDVLRVEGSDHWPVVADYRRPGE